MWLPFSRKTKKCSTVKTIRQGTHLECKLELAVKSLNLREIEQKEVKASMKTSRNLERESWISRRVWINDAAYIAKRAA